MSDKQPTLAITTIAFLIGMFAFWCILKIAANGFAFGQWLASISA